MLALSDFPVIPWLFMTIWILLHHPCPEPAPTAAYPGPWASRWASLGRPVSGRFRSTSRFRPFSARSPFPKQTASSETESLPPLRRRGEGTISSAMSPPVAELQLLHLNTSGDRSGPGFASALGPEYCAPVGEGSLFFDASLILLRLFAPPALTKGLLPRFQMTTTTSWWRRPHTARWRMVRLTMRYLAQVMNVSRFPGSTISEQ